MRSDLQHLIGSPLEQALKAAAEQGFFPEVRVLEAHSPRAQAAKRELHLIAIQGDSFLAGGFLEDGPEAGHDS